MEAERRRLENEWQQLENDEKRAQVEQAIAYLEQKMAEQALDHEKTMLEKQAALEIAKRNYELVMQQIAIAEAIGSDVWGKTLTQLKTDVENAYNALYTGENGQQSLEDQLYYASKDLYTALQNKKAGYDTYPDGRVGKITDKEYWPATLEAIKGQKEVELQIAQEALESLQAAAELPVEDTDWRNQVDAMGEEIDALVAERDKKQVEILEAEAAPEYIDAWQKAYGVFNDTPSKIGDTETEIKDYITNYGLKATKNGTMQTRDEAKKALNKAKRNTDIDIAAYSLPESITGVSDVVMKALGFTPNGDEEKNKAYFSYNKGTYQWLDENSQPADSADIPNGIEKHIAATYDAWLISLAEAVIPANEVAQAQAKLASAQKTAEASEDAYDKAVADWQKVLDITSKQTNYTDIDKTEFTAAVDAYNAAYDALSTAITDYNEGLKKAWEDAYTAKRDELIYGGIMNDADVRAAFGDTDNAAAAANAWDGYTGDKTSATFNSFIITNYALATATQTKAQVETAVRNAVTAYVNEIQNDRDWAEANKSTLELAAQGGVDTFIAEEGEPGVSDGSKGDESLAAVVESSKSGLQSAYDDDGLTGDANNISLKEAVANFSTSAKGFAQNTAASLNEVTLAKAASATTVNTDWYTAAAATAQVGGYDTYTILNSKIEPAESTAATVVTFNPNWENVPVVTGAYTATFKDGSQADSEASLNALEYRSYLAFGLADRYVAPERYEVENIQKITLNGVDKTGQSKAEIYWSDVADVEEQQAIIDAQDDLKELQTVLTDAKEAFLAQIAKDYTENFGDLQADYTEALAAHEKAVANLSDVREKLFGELDAEVARLNAEITAKGNVYDRLQQLAWMYLNITWPTSNPKHDYTQPSNVYNPETFADELKKAIAYQQVLVAEAEQAVQEAQVNLDQATSGEYDGVHYFQFKLDQIQREWDRAYAEYEEAMANLEKGMAVIAEQAGSEQPAE